MFISDTNLLLHLQDLDWIGSGMRTIQGAPLTRLYKLFFFFHHARYTTKAIRAAVYYVYEKTDRQKEPAVISYRYILCSWLVYIIICTDFNIFGKKMNP